MNPKLKKFLEDNEDMSLIGFAWACYWRLALVIWAVYVLFFAVLLILGVMFE